MNKQEPLDKPFKRAMSLTKLDVTLEEAPQALLEQSPAKKDRPLTAKTHRQVHFTGKHSRMQSSFSQKSTDYMTAPQSSMYGGGSEKKMDHEVISETHPPIIEEKRRKRRVRRLSKKGLSPYEDTSVSLIQKSFNLRSHRLLTKA
jgi:hypothetical protein